MRVSLQWLNEYVDLSGLTPAEIAEKITIAGLEVESILETQTVDNLVTAHINKAVRHPNADKLQVCEVYDGTGTFQIVCGAPNAAAGQNVVLARIGAVLPGDFKIKEAKIRGEHSFGMLCSERELGLSQNHEGIIVLAADCEPGQDANPVIGLGDVIFEIGITPNRGDCLSIFGIARDVAAILDRPLRMAVPVVEECSEPAEKFASVAIEAADCPYYGARIIKGVKVGTSPLWMQRRIKSAGMRPVNNVVDITNYVMLEYGQPMHAFDLRTIDKGIIVRKAYNGEKITTLDGKERVLDDQMTVIADHSKNLGLAGVMGGEHSGIEENTADLLLECAYFIPASVAYTAKKLGINSDSSYRYIRGVDYGRTRRLLDYAAELIREICGGEVYAGALEAGHQLPVSRTVHASKSKICGLIGIQLSNETVVGLLSRLGIAVRIDGDALIADIPSHRSDILHTASLAEEVARLYGIDKIPVELPLFPSDGVPLVPALRWKKRIRHLMSDLGFSETVNYSFMAKDYLGLFDEEDKLVPLINPLSEEMSHLRMSVFPGLLKVMESNWNQGERTIRLFEFATVFTRSRDPQPQEVTRMAFGVMGDFEPLSWTKSREADTFYYMKGVCENLFTTLRLKADYRVSQKAFLHPGKSADILINDKEVGFIGALHPNLEDELDMKVPVYIGELEFDILVEMAADIHPVYKPFSRFPAVYKDISVTVPEGVESERLIEAMRGLSPYVSDIILYDRYTGKGIEQGEVSVTYRILFSDMEKTLTDEETNPLLMQMAEELGRKFNAKLR